MRQLLGIGAAAVACALATQGLAETIHTPLGLPTGAVIDLVIERTAEHPGSRPLPKMTVTFRYRQAIVSTDDGYVVTQTLTGVDAPAEGRAALQEAAGALKTITFETDSGLAPVKIMDREAVLRTMMDSVQTLTNSLSGDANDPEVVNRAVTSMRSMFASLPDEQLAQTLLKEQGALSQFQSMEIDLAEPIVEQIETPNPTGGKPFIQTVSIKLEALDKAAGRATILMTNDTDPEALKESAMAMLRQMAPEQSTEIDKAFAEMKMEMKTACRYEMDLKTGLAARTDCTRTNSAMEDDGKLARTVQRTVITQTLKLP